MNRKELLDLAIRKRKRKKNPDEPLKQAAISRLAKTPFGR